jgi:outer membrane protein assembly factor BamB
VSRITAALALALAGVAAGCGGHAASQPWTSANGSVASHRAITATELDARTIPRLKVRWRFRLHAHVTDYGAITSNPIIRGNRVYLQDSTSSVYALDVRSGALLWKHAFDDPNDGPNGLTISGSRIYSATDTTALALDAATGRLLWSRRLASRFEQLVGIAPIGDRGRCLINKISIRRS